jgi:hypothetical protein
MPLFSPAQLIGKTFYITRPLEFYRVSDIISKGDKAMPVSNQLRTGYSFVMDSFLLPVQEFTKYGFKTATRSNTYFTFFGSDKNNYAVIFKNDSRFSLNKLLEQGAITFKEELKKQAEDNKTTAEKITESLKDIFTGGGKTLKTVLFIGVGVFAIGYLLPKFIKK